MPLTPKKLLDTALEQGRKAVGAGTGLAGRLRGGQADRDEAPDTTAAPPPEPPPQPARAGRGGTKRATRPQGA